MSMPDDEKRIAAQVALGTKRDFTEDEFKALQSIAQAWLAAQVIGRAAVVIQKIVKWLGWIVALYVGWRAGVFDWMPRK